MAIIQRLLDEFGKGYNILQANGGDRGDSKMILPMRIRIYPYGLEEKVVDGFRNLIWLYISYMSTRGASTVRHEEMAMGYARPEFPPFPSFNGACFISGIMCFNRSDLQWTMGS